MGHSLFRTTAAFLGFAAAVSLSGSALGQQTSTGAFGQRTTGSAQGTSAPRSGSTGNQGTSANQMTLMQNVDGGVSGNERFMRDQRQGQFVGAGNEDVRLTGVNQAVGAGGSRNPQSMFGGGRNNNVFSQLLQGQFNQQQQRGGGRGNQSQIRIPIRLAFTSLPAPPRPVHGAVSDTSR